MVRTTGERLGETLHKRTSWKSKSCSWMSWTLKHPASRQCESMWTFISHIFSVRSNLIRIKINSSDQIGSYFCGIFSRLGKLCYVINFLPNPVWFINHNHIIIHPRLQEIHSKKKIWIIKQKSITKSHVFGRWKVHVDTTLWTIATLITGWHGYLLIYVPEFYLQCHRYYNLSRKMLCLETLISVPDLSLTLGQNQ